MKKISKCKILLVDDIKTNLDVLIQTLGDEYVLAVAMDGEKAIAYTEKNLPDLILLDIMMPEMDGFEVCRRLKENPAIRHIPIIFITAVDAPAEKTKGFELGAVDYIIKPFDAVEVKARVKTHLNLKLHQEALKNQNITKKVQDKTYYFMGVPGASFDDLTKMYSDATFSKIPEPKNVVIAMETENINAFTIILHYLYY